MNILCLNIWEEQLQTKKGFFGLFKKWSGTPSIKFLHHLFPWITSSAAWFFNTVFHEKFSNQLRTFNWSPFLRSHKNSLSLAIVVPQPTWKTYQRLGGGKVNMHWVGLGQFFSAGKSQSLGPEIQGVSRKSYPHNVAGAIVLVQSPEAGTPWAWKMFFWSFLTKTKQNQVHPSHVQCPMYNFAPQH